MSSQHSKQQAAARLVAAIREELEALDAAFGPEARDRLRPYREVDPEGWWRIWHPDRAWRIARDLHPVLWAMDAVRRIRMKAPKQ